MKRISLLMTSFVLLFAFILPTTTKAEAVIDEKLGVPIVVLGSNLSEEEKASVRKSLSVDQEAEVEEIYIDGSDLVKYIPDGDPNARMFSSAKIKRQDAGTGLIIKIVTEENITQVTADMYGTAMLTAGVEDAIVEVASPRKVTGHSALTGIYKAYEVSGETLDTERTDVANDELNLATKFTEDIGIDQEKVSELLTDIKKEISDRKPATREDVEEIVSEQLKKLNIELSEADRQLLIDLMDKIRGLDIDFGKLSEQLSDFSSKLKDKIGEIDPGFWEKVKEFFSNLVDSVKSWFN